MRNEIEFHKTRLIFYNSYIFSWTLSFNTKAAYGSQQVHTSFGLFLEEEEKNRKKKKRNQRKSKCKRTNNQEPIQLRNPNSSLGSAKRCIG
ncbi:hypothetical protein DITRI_Ditri05aG0128700 [Diplodiscus trichospermus]